MLVAVVAAWQFFASPTEAFGQAYRRGEYRTYTPRRPLFGEAFNYARNDVGLLTDYHTFVMPQRRLRETINQQSARILADEAQLDDLERRAATAPTQTGFQGAGSSKFGGYLNYSHYYSMGSRRR
jgi:hypothetical protein